MNSNNGSLWRIKSVLVSPGTVFRELREAETFRTVVGEGLITGTLGLTVWFILNNELFFAPADSLLNEPGKLLVAIPSFFGAILLNIFVGAGIAHGAGLLLNWTSCSYRTTVQLFACAQFPFLVGGLVPGLGMWIAVVWGLGLVVVGLRILHDLTWEKSVFLTALPLISYLAACLSLFALAHLGGGT